MDFKDILNETINVNMYEKDLKDVVLKMIKPFAKTKSISENVEQEMKKMFPKKSSLIEEMLEKYEIEYKTLIETFCSVAKENELC